MINRIFVDIYSNVGSNVQDTSSATALIAKRYCNDIYFDILKRVNWQDIDDSHTFNTVAGTRDYVLQQNFGKEVYVFNTSTNIELSPITMQELVRDYSAGLNLSGDIERYLILNKPVRNQPTAASTLSIVSSDASDTTQTVYITGRNNSSAEISDTITLTGTTPVVSNTFTEIRSISKSATTAGRITITADSGATTVAVMSPNDKAYSVKAVRLHYTPTSVQTIAMPYIINPYPMTSDFDQPVIDCGDVIELGATMMLWRYKRQFSKASDYERQYEKALDTLVWNMENSFNQGHFFGILPYPRDDY